MTEPQTLAESNIVVDNLSDKVDKLEERVMEVLERILAQTTKTNGRVNRLEGWKAGALWAGAGIAIIGSIALRQYDASQDAKIKELVNNNITSQMQHIPADVVKQLEDKYIIAVK